MNILTAAEIAYFSRCASVLRGILAQSEALAGGRVTNPDQAKKAFFHSLANFSENLGLEDQSATFRLAAESDPLARRSLGEGGSAHAHHD